LRAPSVLLMLTGVITTNRLEEDKAGQDKRKIKLKGDFGSGSLSKKASDGHCEKGKEKTRKNTKQTDRQTDRQTSTYNTRTTPRHLFKP
jgi:hypothetical protein